MSDAGREQNQDRSFFLLLMPLAAASVPSLLFCSLEIALGLHSARTRGAVHFHLPPQNFWDALFALQSSVYRWVARWNSLSTLLATIFFVSTLLRPRWRRWTGLALIPYVLLLCADFTMRWRYTVLP